jgi:hypothetical protein
MARWPSRDPKFSVWQLTGLAAIRGLLGWGPLGLIPLFRVLWTSHTQHQQYSAIFGLTQ